MGKVACIRPRLAGAMVRDRLASRPVEEARRIRGTTLQNMRSTYFARFPLCAHCLAMNPPRTTVATQLDHVVPLHKGGIDSPDPFVNRQGLCDDCHLMKSKQERGHTYRRAQWRRAP